MNDSLALGLIIADYARRDDWEGMWDDLIVTYRRGSSLQELASELIEADEAFRAETQEAS
jgi:hypothetical protein